MKRYFDRLFKPWLLTLTGLLLLSLLIWIAGPLLAFGGAEPLATTAARWTLIFLLFLLAAAWYGWRLLQARRRNDKLAEGMSTPEPGAIESAAEVAVLADRMRNAMAVLRKANPGWKMRGQYLYQLPWYMFVGAPGSGKTTALTHSGLQFPLADALGTGAVGGIGGTRNCDWWFTDEAVLLDTAGRYTTQDSHAAADKAAWTGFLGLLKKHRRRRPVNGVIVTVSVADLLQLGESGRETQAQAIRARIHELHEQLGVAFPVYVIVTKSDLLAGFAEFFEPFGREERAQVWGMTFPLAADGTPAAALAAFPDEFESLERQLQSRLLERMQQERDLQRRALLFGFPQQFASVKDVLGRFLHAVFDANRYEQPALLRGVYFTSGTQEGSPIDRVMAALAASFSFGRKALPPGSASGRSYFITRLLRDVIFREANLTGTNRAAERRRRMMEWGLLAGGGLLALLLAVGLTVSYGRNQQLVGAAARAATEAARLAERTPSSGSVLAVLPLLDAVRALPAGYAAQDEHVPVLSRFTLYQGEKLGDGAIAAYRRLLNTTLLPRIAGSMEAALRRGDASNQDFLYETLRVYLMLGNRQHFDAASVQAWTELEWRRTVTEASPAQQNQLLAHVAALLEADAEPLPLDEALIAQTRTALAAMPLAQRIYNRLKRQVAIPALPEFSVNGALRRDASSLFARASGAPLSRGVAGIYSVAGYRRVLEQGGQAVAEVDRDRWVLGRDETGAGTDIEQTQADVLQLYYADYMRQWDAFLADVRLAPLNSLDGAARVTTALAAPDSPLRTLLQGAARETTLGTAATPVTQGRVAQLVQDKLNAARRQLAAALGPAEEAVTSPGTHPVDDHFAALHRAAAGQSLEQLLALLKDAAQYFDAAENARRGGAPAPAPDALARLQRGAGGQAAPLTALLQNVHDAGSGLAQGSERSRLSALWNGSGAQFCREAIAGRYPLSRGAARDATADDFGKFFAPGGLLDDFFSRNLAPHVDMSASRWRWRAGAGLAGASQEALDQFQRGARIRDMFFGAGGRLPALRFDLRAATADAAFTAVTLDIDGQPVAYRRGQPARPVPVQLPSGKGNGQVRFDADPALRGDIRSDGPWAWLRMVDRGSLAPVDGGRFRLTFDLEGKAAAYELTAGSAINPFQREVVEQFRCPAAL